MGVYGRWKTIEVGVEDDEEVSVRNEVVSFWIISRIYTSWKSLQEVGSNGVGEGEVPSRVRHDGDFEWRTDREGWGK